MDSLVDSVRCSLVTRLVTLKVNEGGFSLPIRDHTIPDLMPLRDIDRALLRENYRITPYGIGNGCIVESWFPLYDSLMAQEIKKSYGEDFFFRFKEEAKSLENSNRGLKAPYIKHYREIGSAIRQILADIKDLTPDHSTPLIIFYFEDGTLTYVSFGEKMWGTAQVAADKYPLIIQLEAFLGLNWTPPEFNLQPIDIGYWVDLQNGESGFVW